MSTARVRRQSTGTSSRPLILFVTLVGAVLVVLPDALAARLARMDELLLRLSTLVALLLAVAFVYRERVGRGVGSILAAYSTAATALLIDWYFSNWLVRLLGIPLKSPAGYALDKVEGTLLITLVVVVLTLSSGDRLASLYLKRGKMARWLIIGEALVLLHLELCQLSSLIFIKLIIVRRHA